MFRDSWKSSDKANQVIIKEHYEKRKAEIEIGSARGFNAAEPKQNLAQKVDQPEKKAVESQPITDFE